MELVGIEIKIGDVKKFVGKVGIAPRSAHENIAGRVIFYREAPFADAYSYETESIGFDVAATDQAAELGAVYVVSYHTDRGILSIANMTEMQNAPMVDLGERLQYRLPVKKWANYLHEKLKMGFTKNVILAETKRKLPKSGEELRAEGLQQSLFDLGMK